MGGYDNIAAGDFSFVAGGVHNSAMGTNSFAAGSYAKALHEYSGVVNFNLAGGSSYCESMGDYTFNFCGAADSVLNNGNVLPINMVDMTNLWRRDADDNVLYYATIVGGQYNTVHDEYAVVLGGYKNYASAEHSTIVGGYKNKAYSNYATVLGGFMNQASGRFATVLGGSRNYARGRFSFAAGFNGDATKDYSAVFAFKGDDINDKCTTRSESQIAICADVVTINGVDVLGMMDGTRRLEAANLKEENAKELVVLQDVLNSQAKRMSEQDKLLHQLRAVLESYSVMFE
jgi:hypothetical protein